MGKLENIMKNKKKLLIIAAAVAAAVIICVLGLGIVYFVQEKEEEAPSLEEVLEDKLTAYETDLRDSLGSMDTNEDVSEFLLTWAKNKEISATRDAAGNVIYTIKPSENVEGAQPAAVICSYDAENMQSHIEEMSIALCVAKNAVNHGKLSVIFLAEENGEKTGVQGLDAGHFSDDTAVFCLGSLAEARVSTVTGGYSQIGITHKLKYREPSYNKAYKISLKNCPSKVLDGTVDGAPNPIKVLGNVLANLKSTSIPFELGTFYGGTSADFTPSSATMIVVINDVDTEKLQSKMNNSIGKVYDMYQDDYPDLEYTCEETELPSRVLNSSDTDNLVSLMYTAFDGIYQRDYNGVITSLTNIGRISCKDSHLNIRISAMASDQVLLEEICESYETICGLCDVRYKVKEEYPVFDGLSGGAADTTQALLDSFEEAFLEFTGDGSMKQEPNALLSPCTFLKQKNENLSILFLGVTEKVKHKYSGAIVTWLDQGTEEE